MFVSFLYIWTRILLHLQDKHVKLKKNVTVCSDCRIVGRGRGGHLVALPTAQPARASGGSDEVGRPSAAVRPATSRPLVGRHSHAPAGFVKGEVEDEVMGMGELEETAAGAPQR